jgi:ATP-dependent helicase/nuclease subunit A
VELTDKQREAVRIADRNVIVSAGAGTGKTAVLVARFVNLVQSRLAEVNQILTITFTEKAADEMTRRIAEEFRRQRMRNEENAVETAYISTIHSFCSRLIRENPFAAGVDPEFEVMDDMDRQLMLGELFGELFEEGGEDFLELAEHYGERAISRAVIAYMDLCRSLGRRVGHVEELLANPEVLTRKAEEAAEKRAEVALRGIQEAVEALARIEASGSYERRRQEVVALRDSLSDVRSLRMAAEALKIATTRMPRIPEKAMDREACLAIREHLSLIKRILEEEGAAVFFDKDGEEKLLPWKVALLKGVAVFWRKYEERKRAAGVLDYEDLQLVARELLKDNPALRMEYGERFRYVLVDEFQDINWLQKELIDLLTSGTNLFVVGDTRQSIYGFRNADVEIFEGEVKKCRVSPRSHHGVYLNENFRSGENSIGFFNFFFSRLWGREHNTAFSGGGVSKRERPSGEENHGAGLDEESQFQPLEHARKEGEERTAASVEITLVEAESGRGEGSGEAETPEGEDEVSTLPCGPEGAEQVRRREARAVVGRIARGIEGGEIIVQDKSLEKDRPARYGDVAVLCRSRASYSAYAEALTESGVPFCIVGGESFYEKQEVADLINLLSVIDNPLRDIPLAGVLRSPFVGMADETLRSLKRNAEAKTDSPYLIEAIRRVDSVSGIADEEKGKLRDFLNVLEELRRKKDSMPLHELVKAALDSSLYLTRTLAGPEGTQKAGNVMKFLDILREYDGRERGGIGGFLKFCELMRSYGPQEEEAALESFSGDAVKVMTIHAAKGLEFPVVVVADMARRFNFDKDKFLVSREMEVGCDSWEESEPRSCGRKLVFRERKEKQVAEEERLLYVAMTRARDHLFLAGTYRSEKEFEIDAASSPLDWVLAVMGQEVCLPKPGDSVEGFLGEARVKIRLVGGEEMAPGIAAARSLVDRYAELLAAGDKLPVSDALAERLLPEVKKAIGRIATRRLAEPGSAPAEISVTQLMVYEECPYKFYLQEVLKFPDGEVMKELGLSPAIALDIETPAFEDRDESAEAPARRRFGGLVHACLEQIDLRVEEPEDVRAVVGRFFSSSKEALAAEELIRGFLSSEEAGQLHSARELYREIAVKAVVNDVVVRGVIDVLFLDEGERWGILDFKTGLEEAEEREEMKLYDFQMRLYSFLVAEATAAVPNNAILYFLGSGTSRRVEIGAGELEETKKKVGEMLAAMGAGQFARGTGCECGRCEHRLVCNWPEEGCSATEEKA